MEEVSRSGSTRRAKLGRRLSRRLSLVTKMPNLLGARLRQEFGSRDSLKQTNNYRQPGKKLDITVIAPDKSQRNVSNFKF
ncbi:hypothetical protein O3M35_009177 [Rhynocoris fuscipes]|uniref:Uncharacterized protein n=1 Tax=Rhynocoris fuscipes TaxID=488301 RepID=A0AAW1D1X5_9HEMI